MRRWRGKRIARTGRWNRSESDGEGRRRPCVPGRGKIVRTGQQRCLDLIGRRPRRLRGQACLQRGRLGVRRGERVRLPAERLERRVLELVEAHAPQPLGVLPAWRSRVGRARTANRTHSAQRTRARAQTPRACERRRARAHALHYIYSAARQRRNECAARAACNFAPHEASVSATPRRTASVHAARHSSNAARICGPEHRHELAQRVSVPQERQAATPSASRVPVACCAVYGARVTLHAAAMRSGSQRRRCAARALGSSTVRQGARRCAACHTPDGTIQCSCSAQCCSIATYNTQHATHRMRHGTRRPPHEARPAPRPMAATPLHALWRAAPRLAPAMHAACAMKR
jgi:hypothetical protein